ncbi:S8 family peptidase [Flavobacterium glaciei]|uniref:Subtilase family protein n=1 Tax=Flavobacterium glaciei TaxID=386300 RepID=A0A562PME4_9FLAO|nr:S8 family peptidase [Flavobacterium glaciei]RDI52221.1 subtilase family protein [Flavobacterium glaciei]TWI45607.1 subtilase family protein [Flavobacterium glaciei]
MKKLFLGALAMIAISSCSDENLNTTAEVQNKVQPAYVANQILIKFKPTEIGARTSSNVLSLIGGSTIEVINTKSMQSFSTKTKGQEGKLLLVNSDLGTMEAIDLIKNLKEVEYAEPNWIYNHYAVSNDTYFTNSSLWGMLGSTTSPSNQFGSNAAVAWANNKLGSATVYIGIIDEGYMYNHEDLAANAGKNPGEIAGNGIDDDRNGLVDDVYGWDFAGNNNTVFDGVEDDHGTHVAGTIGAVGGNGKGVAGVVWNVKMLNAKFLGGTGGTLANAIKAIDYFTDLKTRHGMNIVATNNSWGGGGFSQGLQDAIERANTAGILFIAAAGNSGTNNDATPSYPASYPNANVIAVASITSTGALSSFSQYGATSVDIGAPGSGIWSTVPKRSKGKNISSYASYNGTSMATPHVSGAAALYASLNPGATAAQIKGALLNSATPTASLSGKCATGGRLNVSGF